MSPDKRSSRSSSSLDAKKPRVAKPLDLNKAVKKQSKELAKAKAVKEFTAARQNQEVRSILRVQRETLRVRDSTVLLEQQGAYMKKLVLGHSLSDSSDQTSQSYASAGDESIEPLSRNNSVGSESISSVDSEVFF